MASRTNRRRYKRRVYLNLTLLGLLLTSLLVLYVVLRQVEEGRQWTWSGLFEQHQTPLVPQFQEGEQVILLKTAQKTLTGQPLSSVADRVGQILSSREVRQDSGDSQLVYRVGYGAGLEVDGISEVDLRAIATPYQLGQSVALVQGEAKGEGADGQLTGIRVSEQAGQLIYRYSANFPKLGQLDDLTGDDFVWVTSLALREDNSAAENNAILRQALEQAKTKPATRLLFPTGRFAIGSHTPEQDYIILTSNLELRGHDTTLVVEGAARWFGLATGPEATDGLSNFIMQGLTIEAKDLVAGNQFILMANHGKNWRVTNNRFIMVHQLSSHVFDLGGVQEAIFSGNRFEGYAPEMTGVTEIGNRRIHNFISEAIQLDASSDNGEWDGGLLKAIDPNYQTNNPKQLESSHVTIVDNAFLPYLGTDGQVLAYGASVGQHSSEVGQVVITDNTFTSTLSSRFIESASDGDRWMFDPIHIRSKAANQVLRNTIN